MSLGIRLLAHLTQPSTEQEELISRIENWLRVQYPEMLPKTRWEVVDSTPTLFCQVHPAAEEIELAFIGPSQFVASATTTCVGPGYHVFVTSLLKNLATEFGARWEIPTEGCLDYGDETGYFFTGDVSSLRAEMTNWLSSLAKLFLDGTLDGGHALCLPTSPQFAVEQPVWTPLGPRDLEWLQRTAQAGGSGTDFFAWWTPAFDAEYYLRRALTLMWVEVRWRPPVNDSEEAVLGDVVRCLLRAYELDPSQQYPWAEWKQILDLVDAGGSETELVKSQSPTEPTIGYRRRNVTVTLPGGWTINVPGSFSNFEPDDEGDFYSIDPPSEIWFTAYRSGVASKKEFEALRKDIKPDFTIENDEYLLMQRLGRSVAIQEKNTSC